MAIRGLLDGAIGWKPGAFTPTEAAAVAAVYAYIVATFIYRDMGPLAARDGRNAQSVLQKPWTLVTGFFHNDTRKTLFEAGKLTITLMFIIANALILKHVLTDEQIPQHIADAMLGAGMGPIMFLDRGQRDLADRWAVHGAVGPDRHRCTLGVPDCDFLGH